MLQSSTHFRNVELQYAFLWAGAVFMQKDFIMLTTNCLAPS